MKRCPQCHRVETEDALTFCRVDGTPLVRQPTPTGEEAGTVKVGLASATGETETRILPTGEVPGRPTAPTTVLGKQRAPGGTQILSKPKSRRAVLIAGAAVVAAALAASAYFYLTRGRSAAKNSIAVLPFTNASGDPDTEYLSDGITESLINSLSQLPNLAVKARSTVFHYKGQEKTPQQVGSELNVQAVLNGRLAQRGDDLALSLELVDAQTGDQMWGEQYNRKMSDLVALQSVIARDVSNKLRVRLSGADESRLAKPYTTDPEAYQLYLKGRFYANKLTAEGWKKALDYYKQAIEKDPGYPQPYIGVADYYQLNSNLTLAPMEAQPKAEAFARRALESDDTLAEAHTALGAVKLYRDWNWVEAEREYRRAVELSPNSADAHRWYGYALTMTGRFDAGISELKRAAELDPLNLLVNADLAWAHFFAHKVDEAVTICQRALETEPDAAYARAYLGAAYEYQGRHAEAIAELLRSRQLDEVPMTVALLGHVYARAGHINEAKRVVKELEEMSKRRFVSPYNYAVIYAALGDKEQSFAYLDKSYEVRADSMVWLDSDPLLDNLRSDPRFAELVRKVGLTQ